MKIPRRPSLLLCACLLVSCKDGNGNHPAPDAKMPAAAGHVFPESVLEGWGYLTTKLDAKHHDIRSKKNHSHDGDAFYARFTLTKTGFPTADAATTEKNRIEALLKTDAGFKDYTQLIQQQNTLYAVRATSNYTFLEHQPKLIAAIQSYLAASAGQSSPASPRPGP